MHLSFETERLILQPTSVEDADFLLELMNSPKWLKFIGDRKVYTTDDAREYVRKKMLPQLERLGFSNYTVIRKSDNRRIGTCGLYDRDGLEGVDIGFAFLPAYESRGYAYEAARMLLDQGVNTFGLSRICAITERENIASQKLIRKLGMEYEGMVWLPEDEAEIMLFVLP